MMIICHPIVGSLGLIIRPLWEGGESFIKAKLKKVRPIVAVARPTEERSVLSFFIKPKGLHAWRGVGQCGREQIRFP